MSIREWMGRHPRLTAWAVLAVGMVVILIIAARDVGLLGTQWAALIVATILLAGLCVWIINWDGEDDSAETDLEPAALDAPAAELPEVGGDESGTSEESAP